MTEYATRRQRLARLYGRSWPTTVTVRENMPGVGYTDSQHDLFFRQHDGQAWDPEMVSDRWYDYIDASGVPPCRLHDGRHASASYTHAAGGNVIDIKHQLGVSTTQCAADIYPAPLDANTRQLAEATADLVFSAPRSPHAFPGPARTATAKPSTCGNRHEPARAGTSRGPNPPQPQVQWRPGNSSPPSASSSISCSTRHSQRRPAGDHPGTIKPHRVRSGGKTAGHRR